MADVTQILQDIEQGDPHAAEQLLPLVYDELRKLAAQRLASEKPGQTLQATALVLEAYLRLVGDQQFDNRGHFFAAAAEAMRRIVVENARRKKRAKHGAGRQSGEVLSFQIPTDPHLRNSAVHSPHRPLAFATCLPSARAGVNLKPMSDVTRILSAIEQGDPHAAEQLLPLVYDELRKLAAHKLAREKTRADVRCHGAGA